MNVYVSNILFAALSFPLIAFFITLPYMIYQYRRFGSIPWLRTLVVYSFAFYLLCAYFLVLLPLPEDRSAVVPYAQTPQLVPFNFVHGFLAETTFSPSDPSTWLAALRDPYVYEAFFNVLLLVPLGMYLRYYFRRTWWQTLAIGFLVTLSFETTQLTGLWGLYEHPYRLFDVDDLMLNTLGAMIGFWTVGPAMRVLPDIRLVNEEAREAGMRASVTKRALSFFIDLAIALAAAGAATAAAEALGARAAVEAAGASWGTAVQAADAVSFAAFFALAPALTRGQTLAQKLLRLRIVRTDATPARWYQYLARYGLLALFGWAPFALLFGVLDLDAAQVGEMNALAAFAAEHRAAVVGAWTAFMTAWAVSLAVRAARAGARKRPFVMLNGVLSGTRVMTEAGVELARERRGRSCSPRSCVRLRCRPRPLPRFPSKRRRLAARIHPAYGSRTSPPEKPVPSSASTTASASSTASASTSASGAMSTDSGRQSSAARANVSSAVERAGSACRRSARSGATSVTG